MPAVDPLTLNQGMDSVGGLGPAFPLHLCSNREANNPTGELCQDGACEKLAGSICWTHCQLMELWRRMPGKGGEADDFSMGMGFAERCLRHRWSASQPEDSNQMWSCCMQSSEEPATISAHPSHRNKPCWRRRWPTTCGSCRSGFRGRGSCPLPAYSLKTPWRTRDQIPKGKV